MRRMNAAATGAGIALVVAGAWVAGIVPGLIASGAALIVIGYDRRW